MYAGAGKVTSELTHEWSLMYTITGHFTSYLTFKIWCPTHRMSRLCVSIFFLYPAVPGLKSVPRDRLFFLKFFLELLSPAWQIPGYSLKLEHGKIFPRLSPVLYLLVSLTWKVRYELLTV